MSDLNFLFNPAQVAVIGASKSPQKIGNAILENMMKSGYKGEIYPVNPKEDEISAVEKLLLG
jgi:acyl-CoA synthetase (NDP forming)